MVNIRPIIVGTIASMSNWLQIELLTYEVTQVCTGNVVNIRPIIIGTIVSICSTSTGCQIWWLRIGMKCLFQTIMLSYKNLGYGFLFKIARIVNRFPCYGMNEITVLFNDFVFNLLLCLVSKIFNFFNTTTPSVNLFHLINLTS